MTPEEFTALLDTYGADLTRWPHGHRQAAQRLLQESELARDAFAEAQELDAVLRAPEPVLSEARRQRLTDAILDNLPDDPMPRRASPEDTHAVRRTVSVGAVVLRPFAPLWLACLGFGIAIGIYIAVERTPAPVSRIMDSAWIETWATYGGHSPG